MISNVWRDTEGTINYSLTLERIRIGNGQSLPYNLSEGDVVYLNSDLRNSTPITVTQLDRGEYLTSNPTIASCCYLVQGKIEFIDLPLSSIRPADV